MTKDVCFMSSGSIWNKSSANLVTTREEVTSSALLTDLLYNSLSLSLFFPILSSSQTQTHLVLTFNTILHFMSLRDHQTFPQQHSAQEIKIKSQGTLSRNKALKM